MEKQSSFWFEDKELLHLCIICIFVPEKELWDTGAILLIFTLTFAI